MTENQIQLFNNPEFGNMRAIMRDGEPWFVANDVALALGYAVPKDAVAQHCKYVELFKGGESTPLTSSPRGIGIIPESDVYALIFRSNLPKAEEFRRWVCEEVLPAIRKTGSYSMALPQTYAAALRALADKAEALEAAEAAKQAAIEALTVTEEQRDKAVREKSWIGSKREATAMATAATATKKAARLDAENDCLREQIGDSRDWKSVKAQGKTLRRYFDLTRPGVYVAIGKRMSRLSTSMGKGKLALEDSQYGTTGAYHIDVWDRFFATCETDLNFMRSYRRQYQASLCGGNE